MLTENELNISNLSYTEKDFNVIYPALLNLVKKISSKWDPTISNESDPGVILLKLNALIADKNNYNIDKNILETFPLSVTQEVNAMQLYEQLGYNMKWYQAAETSVYLNWKGELTEEITEDTIISIPQFTMVSDIENNTVYTIVENNISISPNSPAIQCKALQGTIATLSVNGNENITSAYLDSNRRVYFTDYNVAENGIFITNIGSINYTAWKKVNNLAVEELGSYVYKFGVDPYLRACYIEFPEDIDSLIGNGLNIKYIKTYGVDGNIGSFVIEKLYEEFVDKYITNDNIQVSNYTAVTNGKNPEDIDSAYYNYKKTVGTFETLVSLRDYINYIYETGLVSNDFVCDRKNDIQDSFEIVTDDGYTDSAVSVVKRGEVVIPIDSVDNLDLDDNEVYVSELNISYDYMDAFSLKMYLLQHVDVVNNPAAYNKTFNLLNNFGKGFDASGNNLTSSAISNVLNRFEDIKCVEHDFKQLNKDSICLIKNKYPIICKIIPQYKMSPTEQAEIINNVYKTLYENLNARQIDFSQEPLYDVIYSLIEKADERIKSVVLDDFTYKSYVVYFDSESNSLKEMQVSVPSGKYVEDVEFNGKDIYTDTGVKVEPSSEDLYIIKNDVARNKSYTILPTPRKSDYIANLTDGTYSNELLPLTKKSREGWLGLDGSYVANGTTIVNVGRKLKGPYIIEIDLGKPTVVNGVRVHCMFSKNYMNTQINTPFSMYAYFTAADGYVENPDYDSYRYEYKTYVDADGTEIEFSEDYYNNLTQQVNDLYSTDRAPNKTFTTEDGKTYSYSVSTDTEAETILAKYESQHLSNGVELYIEDPSKNIGLNMDYYNTGWFTSGSSLDFKTTKVKFVINVNPYWCMINEIEVFQSGDRSTVYEYSSSSKSFKALGPVKTMRDFQDEIAAKCVLKGVTPLLKDDNKFKYTLNQLSEDEIDNVEKISTNVNINLNTYYDTYTLRENESILLHAKSLIDGENFSSYVKYEANLNQSGRITPTTSLGSSESRVEFRSLPNTTLAVPITTVTKTGSLVAGDWYRVNFDGTEYNLQCQSGTAYINGQSITVNYLGYVAPYTFGFNGSSPASYGPYLGDYTYKFGVYSLRNAIYFNAKFAYNSNMHYIIVEHYDNFTEDYIPANSDYQLAEGQWITLYWKSAEENSYYDYVNYGPGEIVKPSFNLHTNVTNKSAHNALLGGTNLAGIKTGTTADSKSLISIGLNNSITITDYVASLIEPNVVLSATNSIVHRKMNSVTINNKLNSCYWILNKTAQVNGVDKYVLFDKSEIGDVLNPKTLEYLLQPGEYFLYTDSSKTELNILGSGTSIAVTFNTADTDFDWSVPAIKFDEINSEGAEALTNSWKNLSQFTGKVVVSETQFISIGANSQLRLMTVDGDYFDVTLNSTSDTDLRNYNILYKMPSDAKWTTVPSVLLSNGEGWKARTMLRFECDKISEYTLVDNQSMTFIDKFGEKFESFFNNEQVSLKDFNGPQLIGTFKFKPTYYTLRDRDGLYDRTYVNTVVYDYNANDIQTNFDAVKAVNVDEKSEDRLALLAGSLADIDPDGYYLVDTSYCREYINLNSKVFTDQVSSISNNLSTKYLLMSSLPSSNIKEFKTTADFTIYKVVYEAMTLNKNYDYIWHEYSKNRDNYFHTYYKHTYYKIKFEHENGYNILPLESNTSLDINSYVKFDETGAGKFKANIDNIDGINFIGLAVNDNTVAPPSKTDFSANSTEGFALYNVNSWTEGKYNTTDTTIQDLYSGSGQASVGQYKIDEGQHYVCVNTDKSSSGAWEAYPKNYQVVVVVNIEESGGNKSATLIPYIYYNNIWHAWSYLDSVGNVVSTRGDNVEPKQVVFDGKDYFVDGGGNWNLSSTPSTGWRKFKPEDIMNDISKPNESNAYYDVIKNYYAHQIDYSRNSSNYIGSNKNSPNRVIGSIVKTEDSDFYETWSGYEWLPTQPIYNTFELVNYSAIVLPDADISLESADSSSAVINIVEVNSGEFKSPFELKDSSNYLTLAAIKTATDTNPLYILSDMDINIDGGSNQNVTALDNNGLYKYPSVYLYRKADQSYESTGEGNEVIYEEDGTVILRFKRDSLYHYDENGDKVQTKFNSIRIACDLPEGKYMIPVFNSSEDTSFVVRLLYTTDEPLYDDGGEIIKRSMFLPIFNDAVEKDWEPELDEYYYIYSDNKVYYYYLDTSIKNNPRNEVELEFKLPIGFNIDDELKPYNGTGLNKSLIIKPIYKFEYFNETDESLKGTDTTRIMAKIRLLDVYEDFNYAYKVPDDIKISNPLSSSSFLNSYHPYNEFTICQMNTDTSDTVVINKIKG